MIQDKNFDYPGVIEAIWPTFYGISLFSCLDTISR